MRDSQSFHRSITSCGAAASGRALRSGSGTSRGTTGLAAVVAVVLGALGGLGPGLGCSHGARPAVQPDEPPPLPPASGTPIGYLVDDASELALSDDQLARLKAIDDDLAGRLAYLEGVSRNTSAAAAPPGEREGRGRGLGFRAGGSAGGVGARTEAFPGGAGGGAPPVGSSVDPEAARRLNADIPNQVAEARAYDVRNAIARALALLDAGQQAIARRVLAERGVDPDTGRSRVGEPAGAGSDRR